MSIYGSDQHTNNKSCIASFRPPSRIKAKWKVFSIRQCFSTEMSESEAKTLFDGLVSLDGSDEIERYMESHNELVQWFPLEFMMATEFVDHTEAQAKYAQEIAGTPEVYVVVDAGTVAAAYCTDSNAKVNVIDLDTDDYDQQALITAQSLPQVY